MMLTIGIGKTRGKTRGKLFGLSLASRLASRFLKRFDPLSCGVVPFSVCGRSGSCYREISMGVAAVLLLARSMTCGAMIVPFRPLRPSPQNGPRAGRTARARDLDSLRAAASILRPAPDAGRSSAAPARPIQSIP